MLPNPERGETVRVERERLGWGRADGEFGQLDEAGVALTCRARQIRDRPGKLGANRRVGGVFQEQINHASKTDRNQLDGCARLLSCFFVSLGGINWLARKSSLPL